VDTTSRQWPEPGLGTSECRPCRAANPVYEDRVWSDASTPPPCGSGEPRARVLVVDDDDTVRNVLSLALSGHEVVTAPDGCAALALIQARAEFDVVLCDVAMPAMGGVELWMELAVTHPELLPRFVFMTGGGMSSGDRLFLGAAAVEVLYKPISAEALRRLVCERVADGRG
jgi:CheY-like chemotaxis protein